MEHGPHSFPPEWFRRDDDTADEHFYRVPRLVTHLDDSAIAAVTQLYREHLPPGGAVLDLMSSWVSHLPPDMPFRRVAGLGMNAEELAANPRLTERHLHDINERPTLPFPDASFDAATICASIDYVVHPVDVLRELGRVLRPGAPVIITFSNRCFPTKVIEIWKYLDGAGQQRLVSLFLQAAGLWTDIACPVPIPEGAGSDPLYGVIARRLLRRAAGKGDGSRD